MTVKQISIGTELRVRSPWNLGEIVIAEVTAIGTPQGKGWAMLTLRATDITLPTYNKILYSPVLDIEL